MLSLSTTLQSHENQHQDATKQRLELETHIKNATLQLSQDAERVVDKHNALTARVATIEEQQVEHQTRLQDLQDTQESDTNNMKEQQQQDQGRQREWLKTQLSQLLQQVDERWSKLKEQATKLEQQQAATHSSVENQLQLNSQVLTL